MIKLENYETMGWEQAIRGARNPMNSWAKMDSVFTRSVVDGKIESFRLGPNDHKLLTKLSKAGSDHGKYLRMIAVYVDITAPLYWWKEFDTYKVGTTANSTSTMHKLTSKPITIDSFEIDDFHNIEYPEEAQRKDLKHPIDSDFVQMCLICGIRLVWRFLFAQKSALRKPGKDMYIYRILLIGGGEAGRLTLRALRQEKDVNEKIVAIAFFILTKF